MGSIVGQDDHRDASPRDQPHALAERFPEPWQVGTTHDRVALGKRALPQGVCTCPAITNALCRRLDRRLVWLARRHGCTSTRYADDQTFSGDADRAVGRLLRSVRAILVADGLIEHPRKTSVMRRASRQESTGVTVNDRPTVTRAEVRTLRGHSSARRAGRMRSKRDRSWVGRRYTRTGHERRSDAESLLASPQACHRHNRYERCNHLHPTWPRESWRCESAAGGSSSRSRPFSS
jgi:hypothetical protein